MLVAEFCQRMRERLQFAKPTIKYYGDTVCIRMHYYDSDVRTMLDDMSKYGYHLVSVVHIEHEFCSGSGREFWFRKGDTDAHL